MGLFARAVAGLGLVALGTASGALWGDHLRPLLGLRPVLGAGAAPVGAGSERSDAGSASEGEAAAERDRIEARARELDRARAQAESRAADAEAALEATRADLEELRAEVDAARADLGAAELAAAGPAARVAELEAALERAGELVDRRRAEAERLEDELEATRAEALAARERLEVRLTEREAELAALGAEVERSRATAEAAERVRAREVALAAEPRVAGLLGELDDLWPASIELEPRFVDWIARARAELDGLEALRAERTTLARELADEDADLDRTWTLERLDRLIASLEALADPVRGPLEGRSAEHGWGVARRLAHARAVGASRSSALAAEPSWRDAAAVLAADRRFEGLELAPTPGWVPLGPDPRSGLLEFALLATGEVPERSDAGELALDEDSAAVVVLVPGGRVWVGSQAKDRAGPNYDPLADTADGPVRAVELSPHAIGKHELTQAQWERLTGTRPSRYGPGAWGGRQVDRTHPVTDVTWEQATRTLARHGLRLPTEAEWESDARAGTSGAWWTGEQVRSLEGAVNLADAFAARNGGAAWGGRLEWLDDGHTVAAAVDTYRPNPFGLHGVHGNVWEWCADSFAPRNPIPADVERDPCVELATTTLRVIRGGAFNSNALDARSAHRASSPADGAGASLGLRIAADAPLVSASE